MNTNKSVSTAPASPAKLDLYLDRLAAQRSAQPRLVFAVDATQSREHTWDAATTLTAAMFAEVGDTLNVQLVYYRGTDECRNSQWVSDARALNALMAKVRCAAGYTQIGRVLTHTQKEHAKQKIAALVFVGDCCEEDHDSLAGTAAELGLPVFSFQEGDDEEAAKVFANIARLTKGAHLRFDKNAAKQLAELLCAVAAYASGGTQALKNMSANASAVLLLKQLKPERP